MDEIIDLVFAHGPVIVLLVNDRFGDYNLCVITIEFLLDLFNVVLGQHGCRLLCEQLLPCLVKLLTFFLLVLDSNIPMVELNLGFMVIVEFLSSLQQVGFFVLSTLFLLKDLGFTGFFVTLAHSFTANNILFSERNNSSQPFKQLSEGGVIQINLLLIVVIYQLFTIVNSLKAFKVGLLLCENPVVRHLGAQLNHLLLRILPEETVRIGLTDRVVIDLHKEHQRLNNAGHLDCVEVSDISNALVKEALWGFEHLGLCGQSEVAQVELLQFLVLNEAFGLFNSEQILNCFVDDFIYLIHKVSLNLGVSMVEFDASVSVLGKALNLGTLPLFSEDLDGFENLSALFIRNFTVLAHSVNTDHKFLLLNVEELEFLLLDLLFFLDVSFLVSDGGIKFSVLFCLMSCQFPMELVILSGYFVEVENSCIESLIREARIVNDGNGHECSKSGNSLEPHLRFADNLRHVDVLESIEDILRHDNFNNLFVSFIFAFSVNDLSWGLGLRNFRKVKHGVSHGGILGCKDHVDHGAVGLVSVGELDNLGCRFVEISILASIFRNSLLLADKLTNVDTGGLCNLLNVFG